MAPPFGARNAAFLIGLASGIAMRSVESTFDFRCTGGHTRLVGVGVGALGFFCRLLKLAICLMPLVE